MRSSTAGGEPWPLVERRSARCCPLSCSALVAVHSLVDFSLEIPANAATYALLLGVGCARSSRGRGRRSLAAGDRRPNPAAAADVVA